MANGVYNYFKTAVMQGSWNANTRPIYMMLVASGYTFNPDHKYRSEITAEIIGTGYTAGGVALSGVTISQNDTTEQGVMDGTDILMANVTFTSDPSAGVLYGSSGNTAESDPLICYVDFGSAQSVTAGTFQVQWAAGGILAIT